MRSTTEIVLMAMALYEKGVFEGGAYAIYEAQAALEALLWVQDEQNHITIAGKKVQLKKEDTHETTAI